MSQFFSLVFNGLSLGAVYALIALGIVIIFKASHVVTFMHGSLVLLGAYVVATASAGVFAVAAAFGVITASLFSLAVERGLIARLRRAPAISASIVTIGVDLVLFGYLAQALGADVLNVQHPWAGSRVALFGVGISANRAVALLVALVLIGGLLVLFKFSAWGIAMRASSEDGETASLMGIRLGVVSSLTWVTAGALAAVAGVFLVGEPTPGVNVSVAAIALGAFPAAVLGGLDSVGGTLVGGLIIGLAVSLAAGYEEQISFLGKGFSGVVPFLVMIAILLVRPTGLFGSPAVTRV